MFFKKTTQILCLVNLFTFGAFAESTLDYFAPAMYRNSTSIQEADSIYHAFFAGKEFERGDGHKHYETWKSQALNRIDATGNIQKNIFTSKVALKKRTTAPPALATEPNWIPIGPFSWDVATNKGSNPGVGRLNGGVVDPNNSNIIYACSPWGGVWKSVNKGADWINTSDGF